MTTTANEARGRHFWLFGLLPRFLVILTPLFLVLALPGIGFLVSYELRADHETLAARIGNNAARAAGAMSRHDWRGTPSLARDLLAPLIADPAILCADVVATAGGEVLLAQPPPLGCSGAEAGESLRLPLGGTDESFLLIRFSDAELKEAARRQSLLAGSVVALSFLLAVLAATVGFRLIVNRPLRLMMESIRRSTETGDRRAIPLRRRDEIGTVIEAFNRMLERETEREGALQDAKTELEYSEAELRRFNEHLEQLVDERTRGLASKNTALEREIDTRVVAEGERDQAVARLTDAIESISEGFAVWDADDRLVMCNTHYREMFSAIADVLVPGVLFIDYLAAAVERRVYDCEGMDLETFLVERLAEHRHPGAAFERQLGDGRWVRISKRRTDNGGVVGIWTDVTERREAEATIRDLALTDPLTGLANRRHFHDRLDYALAVAKRLDRRVALLFIDLDKLKAVNDDFGHLVGDGLLKQVAQRLTEASRDTDIVVRLGGDEFAVIMTNLEETGTARLLAKRIIHALSLPFDVDGHRVETGASIGISVFPDDDIDIDELIRKADVALYQVKSEGRGAYHLYDHEMHAAARRQSQLEQELRLAIERDELLFHYQPQLALADGAVIGAEALVRWQHPERGLLAPGEFIAAAESSGLVVEIGELALRSACAQVAAWRRQGLPEMRVAVNISARHFRSGDLIASVEEALRDSAIPPHLLELEITESMMVDDIDQACDRLERLHALGIELSIDDFGTGYSCLAYLQNFPVQRLKIDQSFVAGLTVDDDCAAIVEAIIRLGHGLRLKVIAEGIETDAQLAKLRELSCDEVQGYLFAKPIDADAFSEWVVARAGSRERQPASALA